MLGIYSNEEIEKLLSAQGNKGKKDNDVFINHDVYLFINAILKQEDEYIKKKVILFKFFYNFSSFYIK